ncbi:nucleotide exchange factor GrpE [uncultured Clostridium sp.]|uniref:nucleotide exchange factor GrpE n=1 Tax=uncultured Clostridium sp. TaxID=59620 RepID=UPI00260465EF|nr:nucleotide exchange factor GrpE [uncultured Clostridium sp.]
MEWTNFIKEFEEYKNKYLEDKASLKKIVEDKELKDIFNNSERLRKKELMKFERLESLYLEKIDGLENDLIKVNRELDETKKNLKKVLNGVVGVLDEIEELKENLDDKKELKNSKILNKSLKAIDKKVTYIGIEKIKTVLEQFDEDVHYCVEVIEKKGYENETIIEEVKRGYKYRGEVIRESKVVVIKNGGE